MSILNMKLSVLLSAQRIHSRYSPKRGDVERGNEYAQRLDNERMMLVRLLSYPDKGKVNLIDRIAIDTITKRIEEIEMELRTIDDLNVVAVGVIKRSED